MQPSELSKLISTLGTAVNNRNSKPSAELLASLISATASSRLDRESTGPSLTDSAAQGIGGPRLNQPSINGIIEALLPTQSRPVTTVPATTPTAQSRDGEGSAAMTVLKTLGMATSVGPVVTGLLKLFGSRSEPEPVPLLPYALPNQVSVEAGLASDRSFVAASRGEGDALRPVTSMTTASSAAPQITVNVQAMDSRSFLDHSDEIARAVREAMLRSHNLNDVIAEI